MSTTECTSTPCTQYAHAGVRSAGTHGARRAGDADTHPAHGRVAPRLRTPQRAAAMPLLTSG